MHQGAFLTIWGNLPAARSDRVVNSAWFNGAAGGEGDDALTMGGVTHNGDEELTLLELVLRLEGEFRRSLEPLRVRQPTLHEVVQDLVRKRWVTKRRSVKDDRDVCLRLMRWGWQSR